MSQGHEINSRTHGEPVPTSRDTSESAEVHASSPSSPSAEAVLRAIASAAPDPWFPSAFAAAAGISRDSLDEPLAELRLVGLAQISDWRRGLGQGYSLTLAGEACAKDSAILAKLRMGPPNLPPPELETLTGGTATVAMAKPTEEWPLSRSLQLDPRPPTVTPALLIANLAWFVVGAIVAWRWNVSLTRYISVGDTELLLRMGAIDGQTLLSGEWWRLITCAFVHIGLIHLLANLFSLVMTGSLGELLWGRWRLALIYFVSALGGSCVAMILHPVRNGTSFIFAGASGAIWGLMTAQLAWLMLNRDRLPPALVTDWSRKLGLVFVLNIGLSFIPGVGWAGHLGGGIAGFLAAGLLNAWRFGDRLHRIVSIALLLLLPVLFIGSLAAAMHTVPAWTNLRAVVARDTAAAQRTRERTEVFNRDVIPKVDSIRPEVVLPVHEKVRRFVLEGRQVIDPSTRTAHLAEVEKFRIPATEAIAFLDDLPTTNRTINRQMHQRLVYTKAQLVVLDHLHQLLLSEEVPDTDAWQQLRLERERAERYAEPIWGKVKVVIPPPRPIPPAAPMN